MLPTSALNSGLLSVYTDLSRVSNEQLTESITRNVPAGTYTSIYVEALSQYDFGTCKKDCRVIVLERSQVAPAFEAIRAFFKALFGEVQTNRLLYESKGPISGTALKNLLVEAEPTQRGIEELQKAFFQCRKIFIYISEDTKSVYCRAGDPSNTVARGYEIGLALRFWSNQ